MATHNPHEEEPDPQHGWGDPLSPAGSGTGPGAATSDSREFPAYLGPAAPPTAVHVVTADPLYRRIFSRILATAGHEVRCYGSAIEFLAEVGRDEAGCLLLDADVTGGDAPARRGKLPAEAADVSPTELLSRLAAAGSPLAVVAVTATLPFEPAIALLRRGAIEVLEKPVKREMLVAVVREALIASAARRDRRSASERIVRLSERQFRLLGLLAAERPDWWIALRMMTGVREVARQREEVLSLLGLTSVEDAVEVYREAAERQTAVRGALTRRSRHRRRS